MMHGDQISTLPVTREVLNVGKKKKKECNRSAASASLHASSDVLGESAPECVLLSDDN
jgi:hypothetical protein